MFDGTEGSRRIQCARVAITRFGLIVESGLSPEWEDAVAGETEDWLEFCSLSSRASDASRSMSAADVVNLLASVTTLLDLFDEEPMGAMYYPFKSAELIELHCRMATGDLADDAPVGLDEWIARFARHVDWQLRQSGINFAGPHYFGDLEIKLGLQRDMLTGSEDINKSEILENSKIAGQRYIEALSLALEW